MKWIPAKDIGHWIGVDRAGNIFLSAMNGDGTRDSEIFEPDWGRIDPADEELLRKRVHDEC